MKSILLHFVLAVLLLAGCTAEPPTALELAPTLETQTLETSAAKNGGFVILESPETTGYPVYVDFYGPSFSTDEGETLILFLRQRSCIPGDFNLLLGWNLNAAACPLTLHTKEWWLPEDLAMAGPDPWDAPFGDPAFRLPMQARFEGDAIPVWVVSLADLLATFADGIWTIDELEALPRVEGTATQFHNVIHNSNRLSSTPSQRPNHSVATGSGILEDGRSFRFHFQERRGQFNHIELVIE